MYRKRNNKFLAWLDYALILNTLYSSEKLFPFVAPHRTDGQTDEPIDSIICKNIY